MLAIGVSARVQHLSVHILEQNLTTGSTGPVVGGDLVSNLVVPIGGGRDDTVREQERDSAHPMRILIVDDHPATLETVADVVEEMGHEPVTRFSAEDAVSALMSEPIDVVLTDLVLTGDDGLKLLAWVRTNQPDVPVLIISGHGTVETAVAAIKDGALDFLVKPLDLTRLRAAVNVAVRFRTMELERRHLVTRLREKDVLDRIVGRSPAIRRVKQLISQVAPSNATVLITGESGTGKELLARAIHHNSPRAKGPFVAVHCAALAYDCVG